MSRPSVFLAGTIDNGASKNWQKDVAKRLDDIGFDVFNPRRDDWNSETKHSTAIGSDFEAQVFWELTNIKRAQIVIFWFESDSQSPITLLELGLCIGSGKEIFVYCPEGYYRQENVFITMREAKLSNRFFRDSEEMLSAVARLEFDLSLKA